MALKPENFSTLAEIVCHRAVDAGDQIAYTFLADGLADSRSITWLQLHQRAGGLGSALREKGATGQPVLLALPSGLAFVQSLFACWYAGAIPVPVSLPRHQRVKHRLDRIIANAGAALVIGSDETRQRLNQAGEQADLSELTWIAPEAMGDSSTAANPVGHQEVGLLQYTSGSTGAPRGVVVTHANIMRNSALIAEACGHDSQSVLASWLPLFHDMGLIGQIMQGAFCGARCVFMSPERFLMRPRLWLQMISDYGACSSHAPNFAYDLCVDKIDDSQKAGLNLSSWLNALNGSEPVRAGTLERFAAAFEKCGFRQTAIFPCYGLAESTLFVTGPGKERSLTRRSAQGALLSKEDPGGHVACGRTWGDTQIKIVDPQTLHSVAAGLVGEIWVSGESVAQGYWKNPAASAATFGAAMAGSDKRCWLRTGDLGFIAGGELFITGRLRDLIIIAGRNHFPIDLERTAENAHSAIATTGVAAFSIDIDGAEKLIVAAEMRRNISRGGREGTTFDTIRKQIRAAIAAEHEVTVHDVALVKAGALPRTTSGKLSRAASRSAYLAKSLEMAGESLSADAKR